MNQYDAALVTGAPETTQPLESVEFEAPPVQQQVSQDFEPEDTTTKTEPATICPHSTIL